MRVSTLLLLQIVFRRLGRRAKSYFIIIIVDVDERRGGKKNRVKLCFDFSLLHFFMNENNTQNERGFRREQKKGIYIYLMR